MEQLGQLNEENKQTLIECGAEIAGPVAADSETNVDIITNYHVRRILTLRSELLAVLGK